jgi:hypothetical protein
MRPVDLAPQQVILRPDGFPLSTPFSRSIFFTVDFFQIIAIFSDLTNCQIRLLTDWPKCQKHVTRQWRRTRSKRGH